MYSATSSLEVYSPSSSTVSPGSSGAEAACWEPVPEAFPEAGCGAPSVLAEAVSWDTPMQLFTQEMKPDCGSPVRSASVWPCPQTIAKSTSSTSG